MVLIEKIKDIYWAIYRFISNVKYWPKEVKYMYQRLRYGVSDKDIWGFDSYLIGIFILGLKKLRKTKHGCPNFFFNSTVNNNECEKYDTMLDKIIEGFEAYEELISGDYAFDNEVIKPLEVRNKIAEELELKFEESMCLFVKHFSSFWD